MSARDNRARPGPSEQGRGDAATTAERTQTMAGGTPRSCAVEPLARGGRRRRIARSAKELPRARPRLRAPPRVRRGRSRARQFFNTQSAGRESLSGGALPLRGGARFLRSGVAVASAQPFGARLKRSQVCRYSSSRLPKYRTGVLLWILGSGRRRISDYGRATPVMDRCGGERSLPSPPGRLQGGSALQRRLRASARSPG